MNIKINKEKFAKNYKLMIKECKLNGYAIPQCLEELGFNLSKEFKLTAKEHEEINKNISPKAKLQLEEMYVARRREDVKIIHIEDKIERDNYIERLYEREIDDFFKKFPHFKIILEN